MTFQKRNQYGKLTLKRPTKKLKLDKNLAYILGVIEGDGHVSKYTTILGVKDKDFALTFKKALEDWSGFKCRMFFDKLKTYWVELYSKIITNFLKNININKLKVMSGKYKAAFLRGMYDSEGCIDKYSINISNQNKHLLQFCKDLLLDLGIESGIIGIVGKKGNISYFSDGRKCTSNKNTYGFYIYKKENLIKFRDLIGFSIKRKQDKLVNNINSYLTKEQLSFISILSPQEKKIWKKLWRKKYGLVR